MCAYAGVHQHRKQRSQSHWNITQMEREFAESVMAETMLAWSWNQTVESVLRVKKVCKLHLLQISLLRSLDSSESLSFGMEDYRTDAQLCSPSSSSTEVWSSPWFKHSSPLCSSSWPFQSTMASSCLVTQPYTLLCPFSLLSSTLTLMFSLFYNSRHSTRHCKREEVST